MPEARGIGFLWSAQEDELLRQHYPAGGVKGASTHLPNRTFFAIYLRAAKLKIKYSDCSTTIKTAR